MMMRSALFDFYSETTVRGQTCRSTRTHYSDSEPTSLCSFSFNAACLAEKQQIPISQSLVLLNWGLNPRSNAPQTSTLTIMPPMRYKYLMVLGNGFDFFHHPCIVISNNSIINKKEQCKCLIIITATIQLKYQSLSKLTKIIYIRTSFKVHIMQDSGLFRVWCRQVSLSMKNPDYY